MSDRILYIRPSAEHSAEPVDDELTEKMAALLKAAERGPAFRGHHYAACGERSSNCDYRLPGGQWTNSLATHYLRWHRAEIPAEELQKVAALPEPNVQRVTLKHPFKSITFAGSPEIAVDASPDEVRAALAELSSDPPEYTQVESRDQEGEISAARAWFFDALEAPGATEPEDFHDRESGCVDMDATVIVRALLAAGWTPPHLGGA